MPSSDILAQVAEAKNFAQSLMLRIDQHIQRVLNATQKPLREFTLGLGTSDAANGLYVGAYVSMSVPWDGDAFSLRMWTDDGTPLPLLDPLSGNLILGQTPPVPPSVSVSLFVAHVGFPYQRLLLAPIPYLVTGEMLLLDVTAIAETNTAGGPNSADLTGLALTLSGFATQFFAGDKVYAVVSAITGVPHLIGIELKCRLRAQG